MRETVWARARARVRGINDGDEDEDGDEDDEDDGEGARRRAEARACLFLSFALSLSFSVYFQSALVLSLGLSPFLPLDTSFLPACRALSGGHQDDAAPRSKHRNWPNYRVPPTKERRKKASMTIDLE